MTTVSLQAPTPTTPDPQRAERMLATLVAAHVQGVRLETAMLAALLADRHQRDAAAALEEARFNYFDEQVQAASRDLDELVEQAARARFAAEHDETPAAVTRG